MIRLLISAILYLISIFTQVQEQEKQDALQGNEAEDVIMTEVNDAEARRMVYSGLYSAQKHFDNARYVQTKTIFSSQNDLIMPFENENTAVYANSFLNNEKDNGRIGFDCNVNPLTYNGLSNNMMKLYAVRFQDSKFEESNKDLTFEIKL